MATKRHINYVLKPVNIDSAKPKEKPYSLTDGGGLYVEILPGGSKVWRYKYHRDGKREKVTIGPWPSWGIKQARDRHEELRAQLHMGDSPAKAKQRETVLRKTEEARAVTFRDFADRWIQETLFYRSAGYRSQIVRWLDAYVYPAIGDRALGDVLPADVLAILEKRLDTPTTADRLRVIIQQVYNFAIRKLLVTSNPAAPLKGSVSVPPKQHHKHLTETQLGAFWRCLERQGAHAATILASKLLMLTMVRKMELLKAKKSEFDLDAAVWDIPGERMKMKKPHRVFLSRQAVELLRQLFRFTSSSDYLVPSIFRADVHMAEVTLNHFFKRMDFGVPEFSPHGTRGTAATLLREHGFAGEVVELLLAHAEGDQTAAAYNHAQYVAERRRALQFLAVRIEQLATNVEAEKLAA